HGSFGACPKQALAAQSEHRARIERDAVRFYVHDLWPAMDRSRNALAPVVGCSPEDLVFVPNATTGVTTVLSNLRTTLGDEIVVTNLEYTACLNNVRRHAKQRGATVRVAQIPWPIESEDQIVDEIMGCVNTRTKLVMFSLVTSATGVVFPAERLIRELKDRGVETLLDAAHGPGCISMHIEGWGAAYTTGNCHKWLCSPKGTAFLHVRKDLQEGFHPLVLSNDAEQLGPACARTHRSAFNHEFDYAGTDDASGRMAIADAIETLNTIYPGGINAIIAHNRSLCLDARGMLCETLRVDAPCPESMIGPIATIPLPASSPDAPALKAALMDDWKIQIPVWGTPSGTAIRISAQIYNTPAQYEYLSDALRTLCT
ncbi:MAG: aminotransferase class V-fold PLP-dependent enzyme, partial [Phycisphaerales bacterium]|nr:aminotransferase class V-fold PLP-dependent enzyme [Phycisphaerales bacterium]